MSPKKTRISWASLGGTTDRRASTFSGSGARPALLTRYPRYLTERAPMMHFLGLRRNW